jgi:hypothetical protein
MRIFIKLIFISIIIVGIGYCCFGRSFAHETEDWKHAKYPTGALIGQKWCPTGTLLWYGDSNEDGTVDNCRQVLLSHDVFHILTLPVHIIDGQSTCICKEEEE